MCVRKRVLTEKCGPFDSSIHSADNMQSKNLTFFKHNSNCSQRGMDMSQPQTRMTRQRMVILEELRKVKTHPTADELYAMVRTRMPRISLGTVYRNLTLLADLGEIARLRLGDGVDHFDADTSRHYHFICSECGSVLDLHTEFPDSFDSLHGTSVDGNRIDGHAVYFQGICHCCLNKQHS